MGTVHCAVAADLPADEAFAAIAGAPDLKAILLSVPGATLTRADEVTRRLSWGQEGRDDGELHVLEHGPDKCDIEITVHTPRKDLDRVQEELARAVGALMFEACWDP